MRTADTSQIAVVLEGVVVVQLRNEIAVSKTPVPGRDERGQTRRLLVEVRVRYAKLLAQIFSVVDRERLKCITQITRPELQHQRRTKDMHFVQLNSLRPL